MENSTLSIESGQVENAINILSQFQNDPKAQKCLAIYRKLSEEKKDILLVAMDAFVMGAEAEMKIAKKKQENGNWK